MIDNPLGKDDAKARLNECVEDGTVVYSRHFREELANDRLTISDVLSVCRSGTIMMSPEQDIRTGNWKYRIEGITPDRFRIAVVFAFRSGAVFITVFKRTS